MAKQKLLQTAMAISFSFQTLHRHIIDQNICVLNNQGWSSHYSKFLGSWTHDLLSIILQNFFRPPLSLSLSFFLFSLSLFHSIFTCFQKNQKAFIFFKNGLQSKGVYFSIFMKSYIFLMQKSQLCQRLKLSLRSNHVKKCCHYCQIDWVWSSDEN